MKEFLLIAVEIPYNEKKKQKKVDIHFLVQQSWTVVYMGCKRNCNIPRSKLFLLFIAHRTVNRIVNILIVNSQLYIL